MLFRSKNEDFHLSYSQRSMQDIFIKTYNHGIDMSPDYQRGNVWGLEDKVKLIDSIFNNVDIGKFTFIKLPFKSESPAYEILDGKQRITALVEFLENRFQYKGIFYKDLSLTDQDHFDGYCISYAETSENITQKQKYKYFLKLNVSGHVQSKEHIEYVQKLYDECEEN